MVGFRILAEDAAGLGERVARVRSPLEGLDPTRSLGQGAVVAGDGRAKRIEAGPPLLIGDRQREGEALPELPETEEDPGIDESRVEPGEHLDRALEIPEDGLRSAADPGRLARDLAEPPGRLPEDASRPVRVGAELARPEPILERSLEVAPEAEDLGEAGLPRPQRSILSATVRSRRVSKAR